MGLIKKIEKIFGVTSLDNNLLKLYQNHNGNSINEFVCDCDVIYDLKKLLKQVINGKENFNFCLIFNKYILLRNVFDITGITYIAVNYFSEDEKLFEYFCSIVYYEDDIQISNRMNSNFLQLLEKNDQRIFK
jgi:hypothetical protein